MSYVLMAIAGLWMADGVALLVVPVRVIALLKNSLAVSPVILKWSGLAALLGVILIVGTEELSYQPLWFLAGLAMIVKGIFLATAPSHWRQPVIEWCLGREPVDYRFWGLGLCALSVLLLDAVGWLRAS